MNVLADGDGLGIRTVSRPPLSNGNKAMPEREFIRQGCLGSQQLSTEASKRSWEFLSSSR